MDPRGATPHSCPDASPQSSLGATMWPAAPPCPPLRVGTREAHKEKVPGHLACLPRNMEDDLNLDAVRKMLVHAMKESDAAVWTSR